MKRQQPKSAKPPAVDPELNEILAAKRSLHPRVTNHDSVRRLRELVGPPTVATEIPPAACTFDRVVVEGLKIQHRCNDGPDLEASLFRPSLTDSSLPCIVFFHGGGMVAGSRWLGVDALLPYVAEGLATVVSIDYRLAPEHPHPAPVNDCYAGLAWVSDNAERLNIDPGHLIVMGASAGGGLAAGAVLMARDCGYPDVSYQVLLSPMLDDRCLTPSSRMLVREGMWDSEENLYAWTALLGDDRGGPNVSAYAAPARATDLQSIPRTYIDCGSVDTFRDEVVDYAARLSEAGVNVDLHLWGGGFHGFTGPGGHTALGKAADHTRGDFLRRALRGPISQS